MKPELQLRDIHLPAEPSWWPPAPGWWLLALLLMVALIWLLRRLLRRQRAQRRRAALMAEFDAVLHSADPRARVAAVSQLLRRAARLRDPAAAALQGEAWLRFLDGPVAARADVDDPAGARPFSVGVGRVLLDGPYRAHIDAEAVDALIVPARARFAALVDAP